MMGMILMMMILMIIRICSDPTVTITCQQPLPVPAKCGSVISQFSWFENFYSTAVLSLHIRQCLVLWELLVRSLLLATVFDILDWVIRDVCRILFSLLYGKIPGSRFGCPRLWSKKIGLVGNVLNPPQGKCIIIHVHHNSISLEHMREGESLTSP